MSEMRGTIIEENFPAIRRKKSNSTLDGLIKHTIADVFLTITDPNHGRPTLKESEQAISQHYRRIHSIIDTVDQHISRRLENHENQVFSLVKGEIEEMREETRLIVEKLNDAIAQKNSEDEIWKLSNELDYFKAQTFRLFSENKKAKEDMIALRSKLREMQVQLENNDLVMQKLKKKYMKESFIKDKLAALIREKLSTNTAQEITFEQVDSILKLHKSNTQTRQRLRTDPNQASSNFFQSKVNIQLNNNSIHDKPTTKFTFHQEPDKITEKFSIPSSFQEEAEIPDLPPVRFVRVESYFSEEVQQPKSIVHPKKIEKGVQTDDVKTAAATQRKTAAKPFSNTSYIEMPREQGGKKLDLSKSGFFVRSYNQKAEQLHVKQQKSAACSAKKQGPYGRYMSKAFNKSKMGGPQGQVRGSINKSSLK